MGSVAVYLCVCVGVWVAEAVFVVQIFINSYTLVRE